MNASAQHADKQAVRLIHFSDIHIRAWRPSWQLSDWFNKRLTGWFNLCCLGRGARFRLAEQVLAALAAEVQRNTPDHLIFSGDATALGFEEELARTTEILGVSNPCSIPGLAVPGNHDYYTRAAAASGLFERYFSLWQKGERIDEHVYPFAQRVGPLWLVAVNSCTGNRWIWDAAGSVGSEQLNRLAKLLDRLDAGLRILVTHYPVCLAEGGPEPSHHGLRDLADLIGVAARGGIRLWLHGHRHHPYHLTDTRSVPFPVVCAGSATQHGVWSYGEYTIEGQLVRGKRRVFSSRATAFRDDETFQLRLAQ